MDLNDSGIDSKSTTRRITYHVNISQRWADKFVEFSQACTMKSTETLRVLVSALTMGHPTLVNHFDSIIESGVREALIRPVRLTTSLDPSVSEKIIDLCAKTKCPLDPDRSVTPTEVMTGLILWSLSREKDLVKFGTLCIPVDKKNA